MFLFLKFKKKKQKTRNKNNTKRYLSQYLCERMIFINEKKNWELNTITQYLSHDIIRQIKIILISLSTIDDKCYENSLQQVSFLLNPTWTNNSNIEPLPKVKFINSLCRLRMRPKIQLFSWKLIRNMFPIRGKLSKLGMSNNGAVFLQ